ncbi:MAG: small multi-drug export protein [Patescibacteria group bacterium]|jgi:uncharacterized membrane protein
MPIAVMHFFSQFPPTVSVILMGVLPIVERFALPVAVVGYKMPLLEAFTLVIISNMVPVVTISLLGEKFHIWISQHDSIFGKAWVHTVAHAQKKFLKYEKYGLIGLFVFLIIPSPVNGAFSASIVAFILGYPMRKSIPYLFAGVVVGNIVTLLLTFGAVRIF